jgi:uncharacterized protein
MRPLRDWQPWQHAALAALVIIILIALLISLSKPSTAASGAGFNCWKSKTATEATICGSGRLSALDRRLNRAYRNSEISTWAQRIWLRRRDRCGVNERCIERAYRERLDRLERGGNA